MKLDKLYKRSKAGKILYYEVSYGIDSVTRISGTLHGSFRIYSTLCEPKNVGRSNERDAFEQAQLEAESFWNKKKDEGYKTLIELGVSMESQLDDALPEFNTDAEGNVKPMLAKTYPKGGIKHFTGWIQPKLDGVRCLMIWNSPYDIKFISRNGKDYTGVISKELFNEAVGIVSDYPFILDGELYNKNHSFQQISSATKARNIESFLIEYHVFDMVDTKCKYFEKRYRDACRLIPSHAYKIKPVPTFRVSGDESITQRHKAFVLDGYEGSMLRYDVCPYEPGTRSGRLLKVKDFNTTDFELVGFTLGERGVDDLIAQCHCDRGSFAAKMSGSYADKMLIYSNHLASKKRYVKVTIKHFGYTDSGLPRFPIGITVRDYE